VDLGTTTVCVTKQDKTSNPVSPCLQGSQAYAKALAKAGILTQEEAETIVRGLSKVWPAWVQVWLKFCHNTMPAVCSRWGGCSGLQLGGRVVT
jgi:hypothetical protein